MPRRNVPTAAICVPDVIGYRDAFFCTPLSVTVRNPSPENMRVEIRVEGEFLAACSLGGDVPFESEQTFSASAFSPVALAACDRLTQSEIRAAVYIGKTEAVAVRKTVTVLPFDWWEGLGGNAAYLACHIRPDEAAAQLSERAQARVGRWGTESSPRYLLAALFEEARAARLVQSLPDCTCPLSTQGNDALSVALRVCACLERAGYAPVLGIGRGVAVGVWLYESCFLESVTDDAETVAQYARAGNLSFFDAEDLLPARETGFALSEKKCVNKLETFSCFVDVRRCRLEGISPCPKKKDAGAGYELRRTEEYDGSAPPPVLPPQEGKCVPRPQWERRLLDFTARNRLLAFSEKNALRLAACGEDALTATEGEKQLFGGEDAGGDGRALYALEAKNGMLRCIAPREEVSATCAHLFRKAREAYEEGSAQLLYLAVGFLRYTAKDGVRRAPLALAPVNLARRGDRWFLTRAEGMSANETLFELLSSEYGMGIAREGSLSRLFARVRGAIAGRKGWAVEEDAYLGAFTFQRYYLWRDVRFCFGELQKNRFVRALTAGERVVPSPPAQAEDDAPYDILLPLPADSAQYAAIARAAAGGSFVLHGPPGTGKSQTIANIIANALYQGKRVLFVAEKQAALDVVLSRLKKAGAEDFCLALYSDRADKANVLKRISQTLALVGGEIPAFPSGEVVALRDALKAPLRALHEKKRAGFSVFEAVEGYLENRGAPDVLGVGRAFCESLTPEKLAACRRAVLDAATAARECGGVYRSPFAGVGLDRCDEAVSDALRCACAVVVAEGGHFRRLAALTCEAFSQSPVLFTREKADLLCAVARALSGGGLGEMFAGEEDVYALNRAYDACAAEYDALFFAPVSLPSPDELLSYLDRGGDWKLSSRTLAAAEKLKRVARAPLADGDMPRALRVALRLRQCAARLKCRPPRGRAKRRREARLAPLYALYRDAESLFPDFRPDGFRAGCARASRLKPLFEGLLCARENFERAEAHLCRIACIERESGPDDAAARAAALLENVDLLPSWCMYRATRSALAAEGLTFLTDALEEGKLGVDNVLSGFEKSVYRSFLEWQIPADPLLSRMTVGTVDETAERLCEAVGAFERASAAALRGTLLARRDREELPVFRGFEKNGLRGVSLRDFFARVPALMRTVCPCLLMSPSTVAQYLPAEADGFDLVIFDEASQLPTAEAIGALARGKAAIVVGDPKQLPPTPFFNAPAEEESSVLDDCLALGMGEERLLWHYRSRHESLIAFSNLHSYDGKLRTVPSPEARGSRVRLVRVDGVYDRARTKSNGAEAEALVAEIVRRLSDPVLCKMSMGVVTFSGAQQEDVARRLNAALKKRGLEGTAYAGDEPLFVKNLENVQGDERDVILFSVGYGKDKNGALSHNFGPLNRTGGERRLNVAVSRAREEMIVFSSMTADDIDLGRTAAKGVAGLKAFLAFAADGSCCKSAAGGTRGIGKFLAAELEKYGYECRLGVGASGAKIDVAVLDPRDKNRYLLAVLGDGGELSVKDSYVLQTQSLIARGWNVARVGSVTFFNNPKREAARIKDLLDRLSGRERAPLEKYRRAYKFVREKRAETPAFFLDENNDGEICARLCEIVAAEEPISRDFLRRRCLATFGVEGNGRIDARLDALIDRCDFRRERALGVEYFYKTARAVAPDSFRAEGGGAARRAEDVTVFEMLALIRSALEERVALYLDELVPLAARALGTRMSDRFAQYVRRCVAYGEERGMFLRSCADRVSLA